MKKHNFNAGPSILPREVIENTAQAILDFNGSGLSLMEISHRAKDFQPVVDEAVALFKELLNIPEGYSVLFLGGGASLEFCMVPFNFLEKKAVIVKNDALGKVSRYIPTMLNYQTHVDSGSMFNTPPVVPIYAALQTLRWIKAEGGVKEMERRAIEKADMLYAEIDRNKMFVGTAAKEDRSRMNICFVMAPEYKELEADFLKFATERGMVGIKGHRSVGGFRASCYNAMPKESVQALIDCMQEFEKLH